jgi:hypothetical protein
MNFTDNLKKLPSISHLLGIQVIDTQSQTIANLENKPGQAGSVAVYAALYAQFGKLNIDAANQGLTLYAEHTQDARQHPGKHPNIDRLISVANTTSGPYTLKLLCKT